jgi:multidrug efflux pump subunit AcrA (membrane-fusion protein)
MTTPVTDDLLLDAARWLRSGAPLGPASAEHVAALLDSVRASRSAPSPEHRCVATCYDRATSSDTRCILAPGHYPAADHTDGCMTWRDLASAVEAFCRPAAPSPEPESAGPRERNWAKAHPDLADALDFEGKPVCRAQHGSTGTYCTRRPGHDGEHVAGSWTVGWYAARWAAIPAPAPRAAGGTTATDPVEALVDALGEAASEYGYDEEIRRIGTIVPLARERVLSAFRTIATERADAKLAIEALDASFARGLEQYQEARARAESAEARVSELTRERALEHDLRKIAEDALNRRDRQYEAAEAQAARIFDVLTAKEARVSELEAALATVANEIDRVVGTWTLDRRMTIAAERWRDRLRALASRPPAATEGGWDCGCIEDECCGKHPGCEGEPCREAAIKRALASSGETTTALAPWYEADGSTVMLPAEEVERRRKAAAVVLARACEVWRAENEAAFWTAERAMGAALEALYPPAPRETATDRGSDRTGGKA